jgi:orotate phosphoribosyltransferase
VDIIQSLQADPAGVVIALDRQERGQGERSAIQEVESDYGMPVSAIVRLEQLIEYLQESDDSQDSLKRIQSYREQYGVV